MSDFEENDDFMCDDEEDYGLVRTKFQCQWFTLCRFPYFYRLIWWLKINIDNNRNIRKIVIRNRTLTWRINITIVKHWKRMNHRLHYSHFKRCSTWRMVKKVNGASKHSNRWLKSTSSCRITMKWWSDTNSYSRTLKAL